MNIQTCPVVELRTNIGTVSHNGTFNNAEHKVERPAYIASYVTPQGTILTAKGATMPKAIANLKQIIA